MPYLFSFLMKKVDIKSISTIKYVSYNYKILKIVHNVYNDKIFRLMNILNVSWSKVLILDKSLELFINCCNECYMFFIFFMAFLLIVLIRSATYTLNNSSIIFNSFLFFLFTHDSLFISFFSN